MTSSNAIQEVTPDYETQIFREYKEPGKIYTVFRTTGESMNSGKLGDCAAGCDLLGEVIDPARYNEELKSNRLGYVVETVNHSYHKDIVNYNPASKALEMKSRNPEAEIKEISVILNDETVVYRVVNRMG